MPELLNTQEAARLLRVHPSTVRKWIIEGRLPAVRLPGGRRQFRISEEHVLRLLKPLEPSDGEAA